MPRIPWENSGLYTPILTHTPIAPHAGRVSGTLSVVKFHVLPPSAVDIFPPDALYAQLLAWLKLWSVLASVTEMSSHARPTCQLKLHSFQQLEDLQCAGAGAHFPAAHSTDM